jgi:O-acetyl-ADP-ribose deacetylase (regulator of RNase III)
MLEYRHGNLLEADTQALINTVNCVGVMGKGIALQFKQAFPENFKQYAKACKENKVVPGEMFVVPIESLFDPTRYIINFPTKRHWKGASKIEDIESGLHALVDVLQKYNIQSVAVPALGCGNGGLDWRDVRPMVEEAASQLSDTRFVVYPPSNHISADKIVVRTTKPTLTRARALLLKIMDIYGRPGYELSTLEIQKLSYFLQEAGEPLQLKFEKAQYGPYAENLNHVLQRLDGHYIRGYGDRSQKARIYLLDGVVEEATEYLSSLHDPTVETTLMYTAKIIEGYETPYGLELLSTTDWIMKHDESARLDVGTTVHAFQSWNERKKKLFAEKHIRVAWNNLNERMFT